MNVTLLSYMAEPERNIASAARLCYSNSSVSEIREGLTDEKAAGFVKMLSEIGHESPIEHSYFTFGIEGVSRSLLAQITRHRIASFSVQSQRYVKADNFEFVTPPKIAEDPQTEAIFSSAMKQAADAYEKIADSLESRYIAELTAEGIPFVQAQKKAEKMAIEDARFVLPNACETKIVMSMNARSLLNFFELRCCKRAQWEIRAVADEMLRLCSQVAPTLFANAGPSCVRGACNEGKMSCGEAAELREYYKKLKQGL